MTFGTPMTRISGPRGSPAARAGPSHAVVPRESLDLDATNVSCHRLETAMGVDLRHFRRRYVLARLAMESQQHPALVGVDRLGMGGPDSLREAGVGLPTAASEPSPTLDSRHQ